MARRLPPCHCPEEGRDIVQPLRPYLPLMLSLRDQIIFALDEDRDIVQSTLSPSHAQSEGSRIPWREDSYHATAQSGCATVICSATSTLSPSHAQSEGSNYFCTGRGPGYCSVDPI